MSEPTRPRQSGHLRLASRNDSPSKPARQSGPVSFHVVRDSRPLLNRAASLRLDQAELFLLSLDTEMLSADAPRASYLLGLAESHLAGMIELVRAVSA